MKFAELINALTPDRYETLQRAVELGKWPDGRVLGNEERETSLQILIAYDVIHKEEKNRIGYVHVEKKKECEHDHEPSPTPDAVIIKNL